MTKIITLTSPIELLILYFSNLLPIDYLKLGSSILISLLFDFLVYILLLFNQFMNY
jgi:hypothetical protein